MTQLGDEVIVRTATARRTVVCAEPRSRPKQLVGEFIAFPCLSQFATQIHYLQSELEGALLESFGLWIHAAWACIRDAAYLSWEIVQVPMQE